MVLCFFLICKEIEQILDGIGVYVGLEKASITHSTQMSWDNGWLYCYTEYREGP